MTALVITAWSAASPFGLGAQAFADGMKAGRQTVTAIDSGTADTHACVVPGLDPAAVLPGRKGVRSLDRASVLALAAVRELAGEGIGTGPRAGVVLGTTSGSLQTEMDHLRSSLTAAQPHFLDPKTIAGGTMNCAAAQCAIRFGITGPNTTVAGGRGAFVHALSYARRLLAAGRTDMVAVGAVEEYTASRSWLTHRAGTRSRPWLGEGCAIFRVESGDTPRPVLAEVVGVTSALVGPDNDVSSVRAECARTLLGRAEAGWSDVAAVVGDGASAPAADLIGDTGAASVAFEVAAALVTGTAGQLVLVVSADPNGVVTCALLRLATGAATNGTEEGHGTGR